MMRAGCSAKRWRWLVTAVGASAAVAAGFAAPAGGATTTFTQELPVTIPTFGNAIPYPSSIPVSGLTGSVTDVTVTFNSFSHESPHDLGVVLVAPGDQALALMDCITEEGASGLFVTLTDGGSEIPGFGSGGFTHGAWRPANYCTMTTTYPDPGPGTAYSSPPTAGSATFASTFGGTDPNGTWNLFIADFVNNTADGSIPTWDLSITTPDPAEPPGPAEPTDTSPPVATISKGPKDKSRKTTATFEFTGTDARAIAGFQCKLDAGAFAPCTSPHTVKVKKGKHTFQVQALDQAGNVGPPATDDWKVKKKKKK